MFGAMQRLKAGGGAAPAPADFGTLVAWIDPRYDITHTGDGTAVTDWNDHGPNAYNGTIVSAPVYEATGWNGVPSVRFDGVDDFLHMDALGAVANGDDTPVYVVAAVQHVVDSSSKCFISFGNNVSNVRFHKIETLSSQRYFVLRRDNAAAQVTAASAVGELVTTRTILTWEFPGTTTTLYKNGTAVTGINGASLNNGTITINQFALAVFRGASNSAWCNVRFGPVLVYSALTDRAGAEAWFASEGY